MGLLAENKSRSKINKDPNNTKWTRDMNTFGQKILRAQGWQPGQFLGVQDAAHSDLHTAANASYIRVTLKDDMKGLGFNKAKEDEVTGLDVFSDLLSRLNGKSDDAIEGDKQARLEVKTHRYVEAKWGPMRFVRGGLLVGDKMKEQPVSEESTPASDAETQDADAADKPKKSKKEKTSKKRKVADLEESEAESSEDAKKEEKRRRKEERRAKKLAAASEAETPDENSTQSKKKSKKEKSKSKSKSSSETDDEQIESKKSKKNKKEKKDKKRRKKQGEEDTGPSKAASAPSSAAATGTSTPTTGTLTPGSRNFVRSRFIAQKRQAVLDTKALAQIFMVKT